MWVSSYAEMCVFWCVVSLSIFAQRRTSKGVRTCIISHFKRTTILTFDVTILLQRLTFINTDM